MSSSSADSARLAIGIPMYNAAPIGWLSLESVARQENTTFPWEVIVIEDSDDPDRMGEDAVRAFEPRLRERGCVALKYEIMPGRPPLSLKWRRIGQLLGPACEVFCIQGCDDYCDPLRFARTMRLFDSGTVDWIQSRYGLFYDIAQDRAVLYDDHLKQSYPSEVDGFTRHPTGLNMAGHASYFRQLPDEEVRRGVDQWLFRAVLRQHPEPRVLWDESEPDWSIAAFTQGLNTISIHRREMMRLCEQPFLATTTQPGDVFPPAVRERLHSLVGQTCTNLIPQLESVIDERNARIAKLEAKLENFRGMLARRNEKIDQLEHVIARLKDRLEGFANPLKRLARLFRPRPAPSAPAAREADPDDSP